MSAPSQSGDDPGYGSRDLIPQDDEGEDSSDAEYHFLDGEDGSNPDSASSSTHKVSASRLVIAIDYGMDYTSDYQ